MDFDDSNFYRSLLKPKIRMNQALKPLRILEAMQCARNSLKKACYTTLFACLLCALHRAYSIVRMHFFYTMHYHFPHSLLDLLPFQISREGTTEQKLFTASHIINYQVQRPRLFSLFVVICVLPSVCRRHSRTWIKTLEPSKSDGICSF